MQNIALVGIGGGLGAILRYIVSGLVQPIGSTTSFPLGTLVVNVSGCFLIGFLSQLVEHRGLFAPETRNFVFVGVLGGFTTFSAFGNETINLMRQSETTLAGVNVLLQFGLCLSAVWIGRAVAHIIWR